MPTRPNTPCRHPGCEALIPYGKKYCDVHKPMHPEEVRSAASRGYGAAWQKASREFLRAHPLCEECMKQGKYVKATVRTTLPLNSNAALRPRSRSKQTTITRALLRERLF